MRGDVFLEKTRDHRRIVGNGIESKHVSQKTRKPDMIVPLETVHRSGGLVGKMDVRSLASRQPVGQVVERRPRQSAQCFEQLSYLIFLKQLDEREQDAERAAKKRAQKFEPLFPDQELRWSYWSQLPGDKAMTVVKEKCFTSKKRP
jgi:HsdM N-terminal domain